MTEFMDPPVLTSFSSSAGCQMEGISLTMTMTTAECMRTGSGVGGVRLSDPTESFFPVGGIGLEHSEGTPEDDIPSGSPEICFLGEERKEGVFAVTEGGKFLSKESMARS